LQILTRLLLWLQVRSGWPLLIYFNSIQPPEDVCQADL
jgi:hypothetical protein